MGIPGTGKASTVSVSDGLHSCWTGVQRSMPTEPSERNTEAQTETLKAKWKLDLMLES